MEYLLLFLLLLPPLLLLATRIRRLGAGGAMDLGVVFSWVVFVYAWLPLLGLVLAQHGFGALQDNRVNHGEPVSSEEMVYVGACYMAFLAGFALVYGWQRNADTKSLDLHRADWLQVFIVAVVAASVLAANFLSRLLLGVEQAESYSGTYTQLQQFPLLIQQLMGVLSQIQFTTLLAVMVFTIAWKPHLYKYVAVAVLVVLLGAMMSGGSRTLGFLLAFAYVICVSIYVKRIRVTHLALLAGTGLVLFTLAGVLRSGGNGFAAGVLSLLQGGEFFTLFINPVDLMRHAAESGELDVAENFYLVDLLRFIPQQILGVEKFDPAAWYASTYYPIYYEAGGGLAFGAIAESIVGFGIVEALARGMLLAAAYAYVTNRCLSGCITPFKIFIYIWFVVMSYQGLRDTTFSVFARFVFQVLPVLIFVAVTHRVVWLASKNDRSQPTMGLDGLP
jgi:hypothetical protein